MLWKTLKWYYIVLAVLALITTVVLLFLLCCKTPKPRHIAPAGYYAMASDGVHSPGGSDTSSGGHNHTPGQFCPTCDMVDHTPQHDPPKVQWSSNTADWPTYGGVR